MEPENPPEASPATDLAPPPEAPAPAAPTVDAPPSLPAAGAAPDARQNPSLVFLVVVSIVSLVSDIASKTWAERHLDGFPGIVNVWKDHVAFVLAKNKGGAWGLLQGTTENVRRPFFLLVSVAAIAFIMTLYRRLLPNQRALKWGLPLVLGGALGNVFDRVRYGHVIDFIDVHVILRGKDHHWPTFNVADIAICVGVGLMAIDMFTVGRYSGKQAGASRWARPEPTPGPAAGSSVTGGDAAVLPPPPSSSATPPVAGDKP